jgi:SAM-dependent methyltransferase
MSDRPTNPWDQIADHWNEQVGEGNDFHKQIILPATEELLGPVSGQKVVDACCGNGWHSRRLFAQGANVIAFDGSARFIELARGRGPAIRYEVVDACDESAVVSLAPAGSIDAVVATLALMDLPEVGPLLRAARNLLKPAGRFVFSVSHPAFYSNEAELVARQQQGEGEKRQQFGVQVFRYLSDWQHESRGLLDQPVAHQIFHRPISRLLGECFAAGFVMDAMREPAYAWDTRARSPFSWARRPDIPPALVVRLRPA